jgi:hypothetical protein
MSLGFANDDGAPTMGGGWLAEIRPRFSRYTLLVSMMSPPVATSSSSKLVQSSMHRCSRRSSSSNRSNSSNLPDHAQQHGIDLFLPGGRRGKHRIHILKIIPVVNGATDNSYSRTNPTSGGHARLSDQQPAMRPDIAHGFSRALGGLPVKGLSRTTRIQLIGKSLAVYRLQNRLQHPGGECREKRTYNRMLTKRAISSGIPAKNQFSSTFLKVRRSRSILAAGTIR